MIYERWKQRGLVDKEELQDTCIQNQVSCVLSLKKNQPVSLMDTETSLAYFPFGYRVQQLKGDFK